MIKEYRDTATENKRSEKGTKLFETRSADFGDLEVFENLEQDSKLHNVKPKPLPLEKINQIINNFFNVKTDVRFSIRSRHFKSNRLILGSLKEKSENATIVIRFFLFVKLFIDVFKNIRPNWINKTP